MLRVANRIGIASSEDPAVVEQQLCKALPDAEWTLASDTFILHGRRICKPKPACELCAVRDECDEYRKLSAPPVGRRKTVTSKTGARKTVKPKAAATKARRAAPARRRSKS